MNTASSIRSYSIFTLMLLMSGTGRGLADGRGKAAQEAAEYLLQRFGREAAREGATALARKIEVYAARHGDEFLRALRQVGPRTFHLVEEAGTHGSKAVQVLARHGEHGAAWVVSRPKGMQLFLKHGDEAAAALVRHKGIAEPVLDKLGQPAIKALQATNAQSGRRLSMMLENGELARIGRTSEVLDVIGRYSDKAMTFVWDHKGALATTAGLTAFLADPEAFMNGTTKLVGVVAENTIKPVVTEVARGTNWTIIFLAVGMAGLACAAVKYFRLGRWIRAKLKLGHDAPPSPQAANSNHTILVNQQEPNDGRRHLDPTRPHGSKD